MATWRYVATDLRTNALLGELPLTDVSFGEVLNGAGEFSATLPLTVSAATSSTTTSPVARLLTTSSQPERTALYVLRNEVPVWGGIVWRRTRKKGAPAQLGGASFWSFFRMQHLRTLQTFTAADQLTIARAVIMAAQSAPGANIGVTVGTETSGVLRSSTFQPWELKKIAEAVEEFASMDVGFDFAIDVLPGLQKVLTLSYPRRGRTAGSTGIAFVHGKNLLDYTCDEDGTRSARTFTAVGAGDGANMLISTATRTDLLDAGFPLTSGVGSFKDETVAANLDAQALAAVAQRAETPTFWSIVVEPDDVDGGFGTFIAGDDALLQIDDDDNFPRQLDGQPGYRAFHRIVAWTGTVPTAGKETLAVTLGSAA